MSAATAEATTARALILVIRSAFLRLAQGAGSGRGAGGVCRSAGGGLSRGGGPAGHRGIQLGEVLPGQPLGGGRVPVTDRGEDREVLGVVAPPVVDQPPDGALLAPPGREQ